MKTHYLLLFLFLTALSTVGNSQCAPTLGTNGNTNRILLTYPTTAERDAAFALLDAATGIVYNGITYPAQSQSSFLIRTNPAEPNGTFAGIDVGTQVITLNLASGQTYTCTYEDGALVSSVLPVDLTSFKVEQRNSEVLLNWQTANEVNNEYFEVERSIGGNNFTSLGFVDGNTNSTRLIDYSFVDSKAGSGQIYYRLKQVDLDGRYEYSDVISIMVNRDNDIKLFPTVINKGDLLNVVSDDQFSYKVYTPSMQLVELGVQNGSTINTDHLSNGVYSVLFSNGVAKRFIVVE